MSADLPPPDDLEEQLARRPGPEPSADFRGRVLRGMAAGRDSAAADRRWPLGEVTVAVVLALNLWMTVANTSRFQGLAPPAGGANDTTDSLQTDTETKLLNVARAPDAGPLARRLFSHEENDEWDTP
jgi:hypothetical protein